MCAVIVIIILVSKTNVTLPRFQMESSSVGKVHAYEEYDLHPILHSAIGFLHTHTYTDIKSD